jgi:S1-C subfamily serine protease
VIVLRNQAMLGVGGQTHKSGVLVTEVRQGTAAAAAGIVPGDVIATIDGQPLPDFDRLTVRVAQHQPGDKVGMEIIRGEQKLKISVTLGSWANQG